MDVYRKPVLAARTWSGVPERSPTYSFGGQPHPPGPMALPNLLRRFQFLDGLSDMWEVRYKQDTRIMQLKNYLRTFCTWELQELECIYDHLAELLGRSARDPKVDAVGNRLDPYALPEPIDTIDKMQRMRAIHGAKAKLLSQGLVSLYNHIRHTPVSARSARSASLEKFIGHPDEFIVATLHEMNFKGCTYNLGECSAVESHVLPPKRSKTTRRPNAGWEYFLPFSDWTDDKIRDRLRAVPERTHPLPPLPPPIRLLHLGLRAPHPVGCLAPPVWRGLGCRAAAPLVRVGPADGWVGLLYRE